MNEKSKHAAASSRPLSIGALSRATRIPIETLRTWERRYGSPMPLRKPSGHRVYAPESVTQLRRVGQLLSRGHRPGDVLGLSVRELDALIALHQREPAAPGAARRSGSTGDVPIGEAIREMHRAAGDLDRDSLLRTLRANWARLGPLSFLRDCAGPFMTEVGAAWRAGTLEIRHEHFASACVADFLREVREPFDDAARGPRVAAATLPGDSHEGGLLMASVLIALHGCRVLYLGADTPVGQIAATVREGGAEAVAVSVSSSVPRARGVKTIGQLRAALPARVPLWMGGAGAPPPVKGVERFESLDAFDARLATRPQP